MVVSSKEQHAGVRDGSYCTIVLRHVSHDDSKLCLHDIIMKWQLNDTLIHGPHLTMLNRGVLKAHFTEMDYCCLSHTCVTYAWMALIVSSAVAVVLLAA